MPMKRILSALTGGNKPSPLQEDSDAVDAIISNQRFPIVRATDVDLSRYRKVPLLSLAALGTGFAHLPASSRTVVQEVVRQVATSERLFVGTNPKGIAGYLVENEHGTTGTIMRKNAQGKGVFAGHMRFKELSNLPLSQTTTTTIPIDPVTMVIAAALMNISQQLDALQKTTEEILQFLKLDKQTKQRGNLNMLSDIMAEYKQTSDHEKLFHSRASTVMDIKREAHHNILFYQEQIASKLREQRSLHLSQDAQALINAVLAEFYEYQLACHLYAFSTFLDVVLHRNFDSKALQAVTNNINEYAKRYTDLYHECYAQLRDYQKTSIESQILGGLGGVAKGLGQFISSIPVLRDGAIDEALISAGESLEQQNSEHPVKQLERFGKLEDSRMRLFVDSIQGIDVMHNQPNGFLMDEENLYLLNDT